MNKDLAVLSYNISWEATHPPPAQNYGNNIEPLANYCHTFENCLKNIITFLNKIVNDQNPIDFILLQETGSKSYNAIKDSLIEFKGILHENEKCAILNRVTYDNLYIEISGNFGCADNGHRMPHRSQLSRDLRGRPILINFYGKANELFIIVNVHAPHNYSEISIETDINWLLSTDNKIQQIMGRPWSNISVIVGGDFNQNINNLSIIINNQTYHVSVKGKEKTCCDGKYLKSKRKKKNYNRYGDIILTNRENSYKKYGKYSDLMIPKKAFTFIGSDHMPVRSITKSKYIPMANPAQLQPEDSNKEYQLLNKTLRLVPNNVRNYLI